MWQHWRHWASTWWTIFLIIKSILVQMPRSNACCSSLVPASISTVALFLLSLPEKITLAEWSHIQTSIKDFSSHWKFSNKCIQHLFSSSWSSTVHYHCWCLELYLRSSYPKNLIFFFMNIISVKIFLGTVAQVSILVIL